MSSSLYHLNSILPAWTKQLDQAHGRSWVNCLTKCKILCQRTKNQVHLAKSSPAHLERGAWLVGLCRQGKRTDGILGEPPAWDLWPAGSVLRLLAPTSFCSESFKVGRRTWTFLWPRANCGEKVGWPAKMAQIVDSLAWDGEEHFRYGIQLSLQNDNNGEVWKDYLQCLPAAKPRYI